MHVQVKFGILHVFRQINIVIQEENFLGRNLILSVFEKERDI